LRQYLDWAQARPDWPKMLSELADQLPNLEFGGHTSPMRRENGLSNWCQRLSDEICGEALGGTRLDTMICDGFWPLLASRSGNDLSGLWYHWYTGDVPEALLKALRQMGRFGAPKSPACHGAVQGLLGHLLTRESQTIQSVGD